jgi:hypothetical protein
MRRLFVDMAQTRPALKRAGGIQRVFFDENLIAANEWSVNLVALDDALRALAEKDVRKSQVIERFKPFRNQRRRELEGFTEEVICGASTMRGQRRDRRVPTYVPRSRPGV